MAVTTRGPDVGGRIRICRERAGVGQAVLARRAGLDPSYLSRLEGGRIHPTVRTVARVAQALRIPLDDLLGASPPERRGRPCPVNPSGRCLLDSLDLIPAEGGKGPPLTSRQMKLLRRFAALLQRGDAREQRIFEMLLQEFEPGEAG